MQIRSLTSQTGVTHQQTVVLGSLTPHQYRAGYWWASERCLGRSSGGYWFPLKRQVKSRLIFQAMLHGKKVCKFSLLQKEENAVSLAKLPLFCTGQLLVSLSQRWGEPTLGLAPSLSDDLGDRCVFLKQHEMMSWCLLCYLLPLLYQCDTFHVLSSRCLLGFPNLLARSWSILLKLYAILIALYKSGIVIFMLQKSGIVFYTEVHGEFSE